MASSYPGSLDSFTNPTSTDAMDASEALYHDVQHANINDAVEAVQAELGTDPAGADATVAARLGGFYGAYGSLGTFTDGATYGNFHPFQHPTTTAISSGDAFWMRWYCPVSFTATKLWWGQAAAASSVTAAYAGIYNASGTKLQDASISSAITTQGLKSVTITSQAVTAGSVYYLALLVNASTPGSPTGMTYPSAAIPGGSGAGDRPCLRDAGVGRTTLPASITLSSLTATSAVYWMGVSA